MAKSQSITLRIPVKDVEAVRALAARKGLPYQTCIKMLLHEALQREQNGTAGEDGQAGQEPTAERFRTEPYLR